MGVTLAAVTCTTKPNRLLDLLTEDRIFQSLGVHEIVLPVLLTTYFLLFHNTFFKRPETNFSKDRRFSLISVHVSVAVKYRRDGV